MGLNNPSNNTYRYVRVSKGNLVTGNKDNQQSYPSFTGVLQGIQIHKDTYEGKTINKIRLTMRDFSEEVITLIDFTEESFYAVGFFSRIQNIDLTKEFTLGAIQSEQNEKLSFCWMKQGDKKIERHPNECKPVKESVQRGRETKEEYNWNMTLTWMDSVRQELEEKLFSAKGAQVVTAAPEQTASNVGGGNNSPALGVEEDDLPF